MTIDEAARIVLEHDCANPHEDYFADAVKRILETAEYLEVIRRESNITVTPDQRSTTDQLRDLLKIANERGMYDAADVLAKLIEKTP